MTLDCDLFLYSFNRYLLNIYYITGTMPGTEETMINNRDMVPTCDLLGKAAENVEVKEDKIGNAMKETGCSDRISVKGKDLLRF